MSVNHTKKIYTLSTMKQLVDLNDNITNFKCTFSVVSKEGSPFEAVIISQSTLDTDADIKFQPVRNGQFSGEIISDKNTYQNYFIAMRADKPTMVEVELDFEQLPEYIVPQGGDGTGITLEQSVYSKSNRTVYIVIGVVLVLALLAYLYLAYAGNTSSFSSQTIQPPLDVAPRPSLLDTLKKIPDKL